MYNVEKMKYFTQALTNIAWPTSNASTKIRGLISFENRVITVICCGFHLMENIVFLVAPGYIRVFFPFDLLMQMSETYKCTGYFLGFIYVNWSNFVSINSIFMSIYAITSLKYQVALFNERFFQFITKCSEKPIVYRNYRPYQTYVNLQLVSLIKRHAQLKQ